MGISFGTPLTLEERLAADRKCLMDLKREMSRTVRRQERDIATLEILIDNAMHDGRTTTGRQKIREKIQVEQSNMRYSAYMQEIQLSIEATDIQRMKITSQMALIRTTRVLRRMMNRIPDGVMMRIFQEYDVDSDKLKMRQDMLTETMRSVVDGGNDNVKDTDEMDEDTLVDAEYGKYCAQYDIQNFTGVDAAIAAAKGKQKEKEEDKELEDRLLKLSKLDK